jgi:hypothetical protein
VHPLPGEKSAQFYHPQTFLDFPEERSLIFDKHRS